MKKSIILISVGVLNVLHGSFHIVQFIQSMFFVAYATHDHSHGKGFVESVMHNPIFALIMGLIGILTLVIGIKDYRHHKKCATDHVHEPVILSLEDEFTATMNKAENLHRQIKEKNRLEGKGDELLEHDGESEDSEVVYSVIR